MTGKAPPRTVTRMTESRRTQEAQSATLADLRACVRRMKAEETTRRNLILQAADQGLSRAAIGRACGVNGNAITAYLQRHKPTAANP